MQLPLTSTFFGVRKTLPGLEQCLEAIGKAIDQWS